MAGLDLTWSGHPRPPNRHWRRRQPRGCAGQARAWRPSVGSDQDATTISRSPDSPARKRGRRISLSAGFSCHSLSREWRITVWSGRACRVAMTSGGGVYRILIIRAKRLCRFSARAP